MYMYGMGHFLRKSNWNLPDFYVIFSYLLNPEKSFQTVESFPKLRLQTHEHELLTNMESKISLLFLSGISCRIRVRENG